MWSVRFEDVYKRYPRGGPSYPTVGAEIAGVARRLGRRLRSQKAEPAGKLVLKGVSFEVEQGESFALLGQNGAGKTTALRLLARISPPSSGTVRGRGRVGALMEVSSGVHPELSGRENVWLYGSILGIPRRELIRRFDEIVSFAELERAIDTQVKYYSSGMQLRLGFSIASHLEPEIFVVDEALSVGDANFQEKCVERMSQLVRSGTTVLFVSHNLPAVEAVCTRALILEDGQVAVMGPTREVLARYVKSMENRRVDLRTVEKNDGAVRITSATCHGLDGTERTHFESGEGMEVRLHFECNKPLAGPLVSIEVNDGHSWSILECSMLDDGHMPEAVGSTWGCTLRIDALPLRPRLYHVDCAVYEATAQVKLMPRLEVATFRVVDDLGQGPRAVMVAASGGPLNVPYSWKVHA